MNGIYKGRLGHVSNMRRNLCFVGLPSLGKKISIDKDHLALIDTDKIRMQTSALIAQRHQHQQKQQSRNDGYVLGEATTVGSSTMVEGDKTPVLDSEDDDFGDIDPFDPNAEEYVTPVHWAYQGVVATMALNGYNEQQWIICEDCTSKYDDQRVLVRSTTARQKSLTVELSKLHILNPTGTGPVIVIDGDRAGQIGNIPAFNENSSVQTVFFDGSKDNKKGDEQKVTLPIDELAVYNADNRPRAVRR